MMYVVPTAYIHFGPWSFRTLVLSTYCLPVSHNFELTSLTSI